MYESFYQLTANPFRLVPDPHFCFSHPSYDEAHAYLEYAFKLGEGFVMFTGRPGTGKTTLIHTFLDSLEASQVIAAKISVTNMNAAELLCAVAHAFDINVVDMDMAAMLKRVEQYFSQQMRAGKRSLLIIDEAQGLSINALEELRMLADLQSESRFLVQIFLVGNEKLREFMVSPETEQFQQRVTGTCKLAPLNQKESRDYIEYRLCQVGWKGDPELTGAAVSAVYQYSDGIPRHINKLCTRLMLHGLMEEKHVLDKDDVLGVAEGLKDELLAPLLRRQTEDPINTGSTSQETDSADLAIRAPLESKEIRPLAKPVKPEAAVSMPRMVTTPTRTWSRTCATGGGDTRSTLTANRGKRNIEPDVVFSVLAAVLLFLVVLAFNNDGSDTDKELLASRDYINDSWVQVSRYRDKIVEAPPVSEDTEFSQENIAEVLVATVEQPAYTEQIIDIPELEPVTRPGTIFGISVASVTAGEMAALEIAFDTPPPVTVVQQADVSELPPVNERIALSAVSPSDQTGSTIIQKQEVVRLLLLAYEGLSEDRLQVPSGHNAYEYYQRVDTLDPGNSEAAKGFALIADRYAVLAEEAMDRDDEETANLYIYRGLTTEPENSGLLSLQIALSTPDIKLVEMPMQQVAVQGSSSEYRTFFARVKDFIVQDQASVQNDSIWLDDDSEL